MAKISRKGLGIQKYMTSRLRIALYAVAPAVLLVAVGLWSLHALLFNDNLHTVIPNEVYRSAQPSPKALERWIREFNLRSVINLRGESTEPWFKDERAVAEAHGVDLYSIRLPGGCTPPQAELRQLVHLLDTARRPILLHCAYGIERSGIASAVAVLLAGGGVVDARKQFGLTHGFVSWFEDPPEMLDDYEHWLFLRGGSHAPDRFRHWVKKYYVPSFYRARIEPLDVPTSLATGIPATLLFRATNMSPKPWRFRSKPGRAIRLVATVRLLEPSVKGKIVRHLRGGFRDLTVAPGETVVLALKVPPLDKPGRYQFFVDLANPGVQWFSAMGSEPLIFELRVEASEK